jgi:molecular chaperone Hsp33
VTAEELTSLPADVLLPKLFAGQAIRVFTPRPVVHDCRCTPERLAGIVRMLGGDECRSILADQGHVELTCEFCNRAFRYDDAAVATILGGGTSDSARVH